MVRQSYANPLLADNSVAWSPSIMLRRLCAIHVVGLILGAMTCLAQSLPAYRAGSLEKQEPQPMYAADPQDAWNRIFYGLFTRTIKLRLADNFTEGAPFVTTEAPFHRTFSTRTFERIESGDRAIDPLYPSFLISAGVESALIDPQFGQMKAALEEALRESEARPPLARALMQADAWAAFDILERDWRFGGELGARRDELLSMLGRWVRKLALTPREIAALPNTYAAAEVRQGLPPLFDEKSGWIEIEWYPQRAHDDSADFRRTARVFLKPRTGNFLAHLTLLLESPNLIPNLKGDLDGVALLTEDLLIDSNGRVEPSPLTFELQVRNFLHDSQGQYEKTTVAEYELSRKLLLANPSSGGLVRVDPSDPAYLPAAGNDYTFASPMLMLDTPRLPILASLRRRCEACHFTDVASVMTFSLHRAPGEQPPAIRQLRAMDDSHARYVAQEKMKRADFQLLPRTP